jgi:hypothetical protein
MFKFRTRLDFQKNVINYWNNRYKNGGNSGEGSHGQYANWKSHILESFFAAKNISTLTDLGCGDFQNKDAFLKLAQYHGYDVSNWQIRKLKKKHGRKRFKFHQIKTDRDYLRITKSEMSLSMDVILHLVDDEDYSQYMRALFNSSTNYVGILNTSTESNSTQMAWHNKFRDENLWINNNCRDWILIERILPPRELNYPDKTYFSFWAKK